MVRCSLVVALLLGTGSAAAAADDLEANYQSLQEAVTKKDAALVKKLSAQTVVLARQAAGEAEPAAADDKDAWKHRVAYANEVESYTQYALYATAVQSVMELPDVSLESKRKLLWNNGLRAYPINPSQRPPAKPEA